jgi:hypothetical protein
MCVCVCVNVCIYHVSVCVYNIHTLYIYHNIPVIKLFKAVSYNFS